MKGLMGKLFDQIDHFYIGLVYSPVLKLVTWVDHFFPLYKRSNYKMAHFLAILRRANS